MQMCGWVGEWVGKDVQREDLRGGGGESVTFLFKILHQAH